MNAPDRLAALQGLGDSRLRKEDARFIQGKGNYVDDLSFPRMLFMAIVRSPYPHAEITNIDISEALKVKGELEKFQEDLRKEAEKRVRIALAREKLAEELNPEVSEEEWQAYLQAAARAYGVSVQDLRRQFGEEGLARLKERLRQDKAVQEALKVLG